MLKQSKISASSASSPLRRGREERSLREASQNSNSTLKLNNYNPTLSIWASVDPMSDKYPSMSPYMYCAGNPVVLVDPDGREVWIVGEQAEAAFASLQKGTNLTLTKDEYGKITASGGNILNDNDQKLYNAITSEKVSVNIVTSSTYASGEYFGTTFNSYSNTAFSTNRVNINELSTYEKPGAEGSGMMHEITEGYEMGFWSLFYKSDIKKAAFKPETNEVGTERTKIKVYSETYPFPADYKLYEKGHAKATQDPYEMSRKQALNYKLPQDKYKLK